MYLIFLKGLSDFITRWYRKLDRDNVYDKVDCWNPVCKLVHTIFEAIHLFRPVARYAYMRSDNGIMFGTYLWVPLCAHAIMAQFVKYKFDDHIYMSTATTQFMVWNFPSNPTSNIRVDLENLKSLSVQVELPLDDFTKVKSNQKSTYDMVRSIKDRCS